jgi:predicted TIM-barrel fold metal-dependent hydrolase
MAALLNKTRMYWFILAMGWLLIGLVACTDKALDFSTLEKIDGHLHLRYYGPEFLEQAQRDNFRVIVIFTDHYDIDWQQGFVDHQKEAFPDRFDYLTTFAMDGWDEPGWHEQIIAHLEKAFEGGAIGVKVWKDVGMEFKDRDGNFVMIDDPGFDPIFDFIESRDKTLTAHIGEPRDCWLPLEEMKGNSNREYYMGHPEYHMYLHPEFPAYEEHIAAYERMLDKHPNLRYVGCHLGSLEWSLVELGKRLDRHSNMAVDLAERVDDWQLLDSDEVRRFLIQYQDRVIYGTDFSINEETDPVAYAQHMHATWQQDWLYFATDSVLHIQGIDHPVQGLELPPKVLKKLYSENARKWYPDL